MHAVEVITNGRGDVVRRVVTSPDPVASRTFTDARGTVQQVTGPEGATPFSLSKSDHIIGSDGKK